jgi:FixJ family two-component response regulator
MPGMSGFDLQIRLRDDGFDTPIIFVSAFPEERYRTRALDAGAVAFLSKPFEERSLVECIMLPSKGVAVISGRTERSGAACFRSGGDLS